MAVHRYDRRSAAFGVDTRELKEFIADLKRAGPAAARGMRTVVRGAAEIVAVEARADVSQHSRSIPPTIKARAYLSARRASVATVTAGRGVPLAALYELGNKGRPTHAPTFRHPVFERSAEGRLQQTSDWVDQERFPFLLPAAERKAPEVQAVLETLADRVSEIVAIRRL